MVSACPATADAFEAMPVESVAHSRFFFSSLALSLPPFLDGRPFETFEGGYEFFYLFLGAPSVTMTYRGREPFNIKKDDLPNAPVP